uniref:Uncharacterized protein n=1 Tax=Rhizophora mucronata TaxID=61149 RepID=A0A2P2P8K1_RHIMU
MHKQKLANIPTETREPEPNSACQQFRKLTRPRWPRKPCATSK